MTICDEAHRDAQKQVVTSLMSYPLLNEQFPSKKRLFATATPKHFTYEKGKELLSYSMDNEEMFGKKAYVLHMRKAIEMGIIADYKIVCILVNKTKDSNVSDYHQKSLAILTTMEKMNIAKKYYFPQ